MKTLFILKRIDEKLASIEGLLKEILQEQKRQTEDWLKSKQANSTAGSDMSRKEEQFYRALAGKIVNMYHRAVPRGPRVVFIGRLLISHIRKIVSMYPEFKNEKQWEIFFNRVQGQKYLLGVNTKRWTASLYWLLDPDRFEKVLNGCYEDNGLCLSESDVELLKEMEDLIGGGCGTQSGCTGVKREYTPAEPGLEKDIFEP